MAVPNPSPPALALVETLPASRIGVDRAGNLWAWARSSGSVTLVSPAGERLATWSAPGMRALDVDSEWGVVGLGEGNRLQWLKGGGGEISIPLDGPSADIAWIGAGKVALSPQTGKHRVEIWDLGSRSRERGFGDAEPPAPGPGAVLLPAVLLRFDFARKLLFTLESFTGGLQVFHLTGEPAWSAEIEVPKDPAVEGWLRDLDRQAKASGERQTPTLYSLYPALDREGGLWIVKDRDVAGHTVVLARISPGGQQVRTLAEERCASLTFALWGDFIVFHRDPAMGRDPCSSTRRFP